MPASPEPSVATPATAPLDTVKTDTSTETVTVSFRTG